MILRISKYIRFASIVFALFVINVNRAVWGFASKDLPFYSHDTHNQLTNHAIEDVIQSGQYPDLRMYAQVILAGSSSEGLLGELGAHKSVDNNTTFWSGNEGQWQNDVTNQYQSMNFGAAYTELGYVIHLLEDAQVPAHQTVTYHGLRSSYALDPDNATMVPPPLGGAGFSDEFESYVSDNYANGTLSDEQNTTVNLDATFPDPTNLLCSWRFWLNHTEASPAPNFWGDYGQGDNTTCIDVSYGQRKDWFARNAGVQLSIAQAQLFGARVSAETRLQLVSKQLPPLIQNFQISP